LRDWLREDPSRLDLAVEEFLRSSRRCNSPSRAMLRRDVDLAAYVKEGRQVMSRCWRPPTWIRRPNPHPERLDLQRRPNRHIAFGTGIHFCLGHQLARIEGRCALKSLVPALARS